MNKLRYPSLRYYLLISICIFAISSCGRPTSAPTEVVPPTLISPTREIATDTEEPSPLPVEPSATAVEIPGLEEISLFSAGGYLAAFSSDRKYLAYAPEFWFINIADAETGEIYHELEIDVGDLGYGGTHVLTFSPDSQFLLAGGMEDRMDVWSVADGELYRSFKMADLFDYNIQYATAAASDVEFANETNFLIASKSDHGGLGQINISTGEYIQIFEKPVYDIALSSTEPVAVLATQSVAIDFWESEYPVVLFDYEKGSVVGEYFGTDPFDNPYEHLPAADSVALSPDGRYIAAIVEFSTLRVWDRIQEEEISVDVPAVIGYMRQVGFSPQGHLVTISAISASCRSYAWGLKDPEGKCTLAFWEVPSFELIAFEEMGLIVSFDFSADGSTIVTAGDELRFWEIP